MSGREIFVCIPGLVKLVNYATTSEELNYLGHVTEQASSFTVDTESTYRPYLTDLPSLIQKIWENIFRQREHIYAWGDLMDELRQLLFYQMFTNQQIPSSVPDTD
ncbi:unnamed protein product [Didymodactylos carnosus]|uniref:Uncharacterized protein n=1 Tax=Didymodactylos carnosus TaxID=1234261 RepID=A0A814R734_9BILA|nr:unnamed protein product [Didymodactylos carnosus]CAF3893539.1 unnamed protein product [Didymodactylos carnosus]